MTQSADPWLDLPPASYQADGFPEIIIPVDGIDENGALRVARRARPWQPGVKLDHTGHDADKFTLKMLWSNDVEEPGIDGPIWPDKLEELIRQFKSGKTATLNLPWKRGIRVKPTTWSRSATATDNRGGELVTLNFETDNEDDLDREAFAAVTVKATLQGTVEEAVFDLESAGMSGVLAPTTFDADSPFGGGSIEDITELAANLVGLLNAPGEYAQAILHQATRLRRATETVMSAFSTTTPGRDQMNDPTGSSARLKLLELLELAGSAELEARAALPRTRTITTDRDTDIWTIASERGQNARQLMSINGAIEDFGAIPRGTPVLVFAEG